MKGVNLLVYNNHGMFGAQKLYGTKYSIAFKQLKLGSNNYLDTARFLTKQEMHQYKT